MAVTENVSADLWQLDQNEAFFYVPASGGHSVKEIEDHFGLQSFLRRSFCEKIVEDKTFLHIFVALFIVEFFYAYSRLKSIRLKRK